MKIFICGMSHRTATVALRERLAVSDQDLPKALEMLKNLAGLEEVAVLGTCNRFEIYGVSSEPMRDPRRLEPFLTEFFGLSAADLAPHLYLYDEPDTVLHLMRVASSLDSQIIGEGQILGQVKDAFRNASDLGTTGKLLNKLFQRAIEVGKRVRTETEIGSIPVSISSAAVDLARRIFGNLAERSVLVVGVGEMSETTLRHLAAQGTRDITVTNRTLVRASSLATLFGGRAVPLDQLEAELAHPDIVISSTGSAEPVITAKMVREAMVRRRRRPLFLIDIAVPRDIESEAGAEEDVYLYNIDELQAVAERNVNSRMSEAVKAESKVLEAREEFLRWRRAQETVPILVALDQLVDSIVQEEVQKVDWKLDGVPEKDRAMIRRGLRNVARKVQHLPITMIRLLTEEETPRAVVARLQKEWVESGVATGENVESATTPEPIRLGAKEAK